MPTSSLRDRFGSERAAADAGKYHTYKEANDEMLALAKKYPKLARVEKIGTSFEKRDVYALIISGAPKGAKVPKAIFMGLHHAREWISVEVPLAIANELLNKYATDAKIKALVDRRVVYVVPVVNPDGLIWSQTEYSYWRKNRNDNDGNSKKGVDPNRNYGYQWGTVGASTYPGSDTYHGKNPFSEPCTQNMKRLAEKEKFTASISYHSYSQLVLYPFGYGYDIPNPDRGIFEKLANGMGKLTRYRAQNSAELYPAMGDSDDWFYGSMGILAFTLELGRSFVPSESEIDSINAKNVKAALYLLEELDTAHASNHPDKVSAVHFQTSRARFVAAQVDALRKNGDETAIANALNELDSTRGRIVSLLDPEEDVDGVKFREFLSILSGCNEGQRTLLLPILQDLKGAYITGLEKGNLPAKLTTNRVDIIEELLNY
jgi:carboxypeptidase T